MPTRRRLGRALQSLGSGNLAGLLQSQLQNNLILERQRQLAEEQGEIRGGIETEQARINALPDIFRRLTEGAIRPEQATAQFQGMFPEAEVPDFGAATRSMPQEIEAVLAGVDEQGTAEDVQRALAATPAFENEPGVARTAVGPPRPEVSAAMDFPTRQREAGLGLTEETSFRQARGQGLGTAEARHESAPEALADELIRTRAVGEVENELQQQFIESTIPLKAQTEHAIALARIAPDILEREIAHAAEMAELKNMTDQPATSEFNAVNFHSRAVRSHNHLLELESALSDVEIQDAINVIQSVIQSSSGQDGIINWALFDRFGQALGELNPLQQRYLQSSQEWIMAVLRKETGAAIAAQEYVREMLASIRTQGNDPQTILWKQQGRLARGDALELEGQRVFAQNPGLRQEHGTMIDPVAAAPSDAGTAAPAVPLLDQLRQNPVVP